MKLKYYPDMPVEEGMFFVPYEAIVDKRLHRGQAFILFAQLLAIGFDVDITFKDARKLLPRVSESTARRAWNKLVQAGYLHENDGA